ncbi:DUF3679 domain-containing protein [Kroppenstedtia eburnea]|uniref:DUF3679 domain-containing protein n=1 Tax=Kroppenstedtia eburnea TaxID=714067 RepID=UPI00363CC692
MRLLIQVLALTMVLMFGIFLGIDTAEQNIHRNQGSEGAPRAVHITPRDGRVEIAVLGHVYQTESPVVIQEEQEPGPQEPSQAEPAPTDPGDSGWLTTAGNQAGEGIKQATRKAIEQVVGWFQEKNQ